MIERIVEDRVFTNVRPATQNPPPLNRLRVQLPDEKINLSPFIEELRVTATLWAPLLPFTICSSRMLSISDIGTYRIQFGSIVPDPFAFGTQRASALAIRFAKTEGDLRNLSFFGPQPVVTMISAFELQRESRVSSIVIIFSSSS